MEIDPGFRQRTEALRQALREVEALLGQTDASLDTLASEPPSAVSVRQLDRLRFQFEEAVKAYLDQNTAFVDFVREQAWKIEEADRRAAMSEKQSRPPKNEARIQELSDELTRGLRLQRIDGAIKELLDFLSDRDFFAANASTGRRRRLRTLQKAIDAALQ